jgi:hypothetical protein
MGRVRLNPPEAMTAAALLLSGCRIVIDTRVDADGSGEVRSAVVFTAEEVQGFAQTPGNESKSVCDSLRRDLPPETAFAEEEREGETYCVTTQPFGDLRELRRLYAEMSNVTVNELEMGFGRFVFDVDVDLSEAGPDQEEPVANEWRLTVPGALGANNADRVEGQTLIWTVAPGERANLHAESSVGLDPATLGVAGGAALICLCAAAALGGGIGFFMGRRPKRPAPPALNAASSRPSA